MNEKYEIEIIDWNECREENQKIKERMAENIK